MERRRSNPLGREHCHSSVQAAATALVVACTLALQVFSRSEKFPAEDGLSRIGRCCCSGKCQSCIVISAELDLASKILALATN